MAVLWRVAGACRSEHDRPSTIQSDHQSKASRLRNAARFCRNRTLYLRCSARQVSPRLRAMVTACSFYVADLHANHSIRNCGNPLYRGIRFLSRWPHKTSEGELTLPTRCGQSLSARCTSARDHRVDVHRLYSRSWLTALLQAIEGALHLAVTTLAYAERSGREVDVLYPRSHTFTYPQPCATHQYCHQAWGSGHVLQDRPHLFPVSTPPAPDVAAVPGLSPASSPSGVCSTES